MGTIIDITQYNLDRALAGDEVAAKLKLRNQSHMNLLEHMKNVPYGVAKVSQIVVFPDKNIQLSVGEYKPINVKEDKIENIREHADILISMANGEQQLSESQDITDNQPIASEVNDVQTAVEQDESISSVDAEVASINNDSIVDISEYITKLNNETRLLKDAKVASALAQQEADASDEKVSKLSVEVSELEKQEVAVVKQNAELDRQIIVAYEDQTRTLVLARKEHEDIIQEANERKQENDNKITQFDSMKNDIMERITTGNESIARKQAILAALQQTEFPDISNLIQFSDQSDAIQITDDSEEKVKRIA